MDIYEIYLINIIRPHYNSVFNRREHLSFELPEIDWINYRNGLSRIDPDPREQTLVNDAKEKSFKELLICANFQIDKVITRITWYLENIEDYIELKKNIILKQSVQGIKIELTYLKNYDKDEKLIYDNEIKRILNID